MSGKVDGHLTRLNRDLPQDTRTPQAPNSVPEKAATRQAEPSASPFMLRTATNYLSPAVAPFPSASSCPISTYGNSAPQT